jgi:hypothetical protein
MRPYCHSEQMKGCIFLQGIKPLYLVLHPFPEQAYENENTMDDCNILLIFWTFIVTVAALLSLSWL